MRGIMFASNDNQTCESNETRADRTRGAWRPLHKSHWYEANKSVRIHVFLFHVIGISGISN